MKSLKDYALNIPDEQYHALPSWSHSMIVKYATGGFAALKTLHEKTDPTPSMEFGSLFDSMITKGKATMDDYVVDKDNVSCPPAEKEVFDKLIALGFGEYSYDNLAGMYMGSLIKIMNSCESFCSKYKKEETKFTNLAKNSAYYELHRTGKKVVSQQDWDDAVEMYHVFRKDPYLKELFGTRSTKDVEYIYQAQFETDMTVAGRSVRFRIMPDLLIVNHNDKTIRYVDLKTSSVPAYDFWENFIKFRYDLQAESYTDVLYKVLKQIGGGYEDYRILPVLFTDISRSDKVPVTWEYEPAYGFSYTRGGKEYTYKGCWELLAEILDYEESNAVVPDNIITDGPNDLISVLNSR